jgi:hypothetical protein
MDRRRFLLTSIAAVIAAPPAHAQSQRVSIDWLAGTFNGRALAEWSLDGVTDAFGRPTTAERDFFGIPTPQLHYHDTGLSFRFASAEKDPSLRSVKIYLVRWWDRDFKLHYQQFRGELSPVVDGSWKEDRLMRDFAEHNPTLETSEERERRLKARIGVDRIMIKREHHYITFWCEQTTKFLEHMLLMLGRPA